MTEFTGARNQIEHVFEERMKALTAGVEAAVGESLAQARREVAGKLNQSVRRLRNASNEERWSAALVEATQGFCDRAVLFLVHEGTLRLAAARKVDGSVEEVSLRTAPAFASAVESKDTVIAMRIAGEMSHPIATLLGTADHQKFYVFPVIAQRMVAALLYADAGDRALDANALELLAMVAGAVMPAAQKAEPSSELVHIALNSVGKGAAPSPNGTHELSPQDRELHSQAQRFARVQVAEMRLYKSEEVKNGRSARDLYASLKTEIDAARESYRTEHLSSARVDYLHQELVRTLARNDVELLGPEYPGPLA